MKKFSELPLVAQLGIFLVLPAILVGVSEYLYFPFASGTAGTLQEWQAANAVVADKLDKLKKENDGIEPFRKRLPAITADNKKLNETLESLKDVVPADKDVDVFLKMVRKAGDETGVEVRRFTPLPTATKEFYVELPFEIEVDGTWHSVMQFFERVGNLPRIANLSNIGIGPLTGGVKGVKKHYDYASSETTAAGCTVTTFFRRPDQGGKK